MNRNPARCGVVIITAALLIAAVRVTPARGADCNGNGVVDTLDISRGTSQDCNDNDVLDECDLSGIRFAAPVYYGIPQGASLVRSADLDEDGDTDLGVSAGQGGADVSVLLNGGTGVFGEATPYSAPEWPQEFLFLPRGTAGPDILVMRGSARKLSRLANLGAGTFGAPVDVLSATIHCIRLADLDGDGDDDIAMAKWSYGYEVSKLVIWETDGAGTVTETREYNVGNAIDEIVLADLDGDTDIDVAVGDGKAACDCIRIMLNNGNATFTTAPNVIVGGVPYRLAGGDLDGDGDVDLAMAKDTYKFSILLNNGNAGFTEVAYPSIPSVPGCLEISDLDRDEDLDIAVPNGAQVTFLVNRGNATFGPMLHINLESAPYGRNGTSLTAADLNGDNWPDLAIAHSESDDVTVLINESGPSASRDIDRNGVPDECECVKTCNWDGDHDVDLDDYAAFQTCVSGAMVPRIPACEGKDFDCDNDVDADDFGVFQRCYSGAGRSADPHCDA